MALAIAASGCRGIVGVEHRRAAPVTGDTEGTSGSGGVGGGPSQCASFPGSAACAACMSSACCDQVTACVADGGCAKAFACIDACATDDQLCQRDCVSSDSHALFDVIACRATSCSDACALACGGLAPAYQGLVAPPASEGCTDCFLQHTCDALAACATTPECLAYLECRGRCRPIDVGCTGGCTAAHPGANDAIVAADAMALPMCTDSCDLGRDTTCVGHVTAPFSASQTTISLTQQIVSFGTNGMPIAGATLDACDPALPPCSSVSKNGKQTTGATGRATVDVGVSPGFSFFYGYTYAVADGFLPVLFYPVAPVAQTADIGPAYVVPSSLFDTLAKIVTPMSPWEPTSTGVLIVAAFDCQELLAPGVAITLDPPGGTTVYLHTNIADWKTAASTDSDGVTVIYGIPPRIVTVHGTAADGVVFATRIVRVEAGMVTLLGLAPTP